MAYVKTWSTKEEVLKDLARASGRRMRKKEDLDEGYLVIGNAPPPVIVEDEDDEMQLLFGDAASRKTVPIEDAAPDLEGIQEMLRMVQNYEDEESGEIGINSADCVIAISKVNGLNPDVPEFVPKSATSCPSVNSKDLISNSNTTLSKNDINVNTNIVTQSDAVLVEDSSNNLTDNKCDNSVNVNAEQLNELQGSGYKNIATELKNKISDAAKSDTFELKKQKNVAIATLLRLYAAQKSPEPIKLITPDYFQSKKEDVEKESETIAPQSLTSSSSTPDPTSIKNSSTLPTGSSTSISSTPLQTSSEQETERQRKTVPTTIKIDPEIKRSIEKVNKWLEEPSKRKSPAVCIGPIAFKRKESSSCKSPVSTTDQNVLKPSGEGQRYQPSNYAADLGRKYMERNKIKEEKENQVTWTNLEDVLKQKDLTIKKRLEEQQASTSDSNEDGSVALRL